MERCLLLACVGETMKRNKCFAGIYLTSYAARSRTVSGMKYPCSFTATSKRPRRTQRWLQQQQQQQNVMNNTNQHKSATSTTPSTNIFLPMKDSWIPRWAIVNALCLWAVGTPTFVKIATCVTHFVCGQSHSSHQVHCLHCGSPTWLENPTIWRCFSKCKQIFKQYHPRTSKLYTQVADIHIL